MNKEYKCKKCRAIVNYTEIEKNLDLGSHTEGYPVLAFIPHIHKNCGGIVTPVKNKK
jgi:hypothetical protein